MIEARHVSKRYGPTLAVDDLSFTVEAGQVTGFLGPNGSGKSTTMRMIVGLDAPSSGEITVGGRGYGKLRFPLHEVGALLDANAIHPGRSARNHLLWLADSNAIPRSRVEEVLGAVGLTEVSHRRAGDFSLGMGQRLGIAAALLGDPEVLIFDEPINGLDPEGILSGPSPAALAGRRGPHRPGLQPPDVRDGPDGRPPHRHRTRPSAGRRQRRGLHRARRGPPRPGADSRPGHPRRPAARQGADVTADGTEGLTVKGMECRDVGTAAAGAGLTLYELSTWHASLEDAFMELTGDHADFRATTRGTAHVVAAAGNPQRSTS